MTIYDLNDRFKWPYPIYTTDSSMLMKEAIPLKPLMSGTLFPNVNNIQATISEGQNIYLHNDVGAILQDVDEYSTRLFEIILLLILNCSSKKNRTEHLFLN